MFERKFEFTVHQPLDMCEERLRRTAPQFDTSETPVLKAIGRSENTLEVKMAANASERYSYAMLEATLRTQEHDTVHITGRVYANKLRNGMLILIVASPLGICKGTQHIHNYATFGDFMRSATIITIVAVSVAIAVATGVSIYDRNRLIKFFEETITQPKKKKRA